MSAVSFDEFNTVCNIIDPREEESGDLLLKMFQSCIQNVKHEFQYPQYYNGLIALLVLFNHNELYDLKDRSCITLLFEETKQLAIMGYDEYTEFGLHSLENLISTLHEMCGIFKKLYPFHSLVCGKPTVVLQGCKQNYTKEEECFEHKNGIRTQIKPIDFSKSNYRYNYHEEGIADIYQQIPMAKRLDSDNRIQYTFSNFEKSCASVTVGFVITTLIGKILYFYFQIFITFTCYYL